MKPIFVLCVAVLFLQGSLASGQEAPGKSGSAPIYSVTVVARTTKAINYQYRAGPTRIDFRGTVLLPAGKGDATVESQRGRTDIQASFENLTPPTQYGREYLTYTLWAITPEGGPHNLGEVIPGGSNKARLHVTTDLQAFGLIVTAEPYSSARQPSNVVVMENEVRADTIGKIQTIDAKFELLPRGHYTWHVPDSLQSPSADQHKVSMNKYEEQLQLYEAQNAIGIARSANAATYAPNTIGKAEALLQEAQKLQASKAPTSVVIQNAREAAQTAEDARLISERRAHDEKLATAEHQAADAKLAQEQAQAEARRANAEADAARAQIEAERSARLKAESDAADARMRADQARVTSAPTAVKPVVHTTQPSAQAADSRMRLLEELNGVLSTRDTPRGLVVTIADPDFNGMALREQAAGQVARLAALLISHSHLRVAVEGYTDSATTNSTSLGRAQAVEGILLGKGLPESNISARGLGDARPLSSNSSPAGREQNRRVEIVISGDSIGNLPYWDRTYSLLPR
jgi:outer membrane protein OmpA-like peptidoglycan-associated protein